MSSIKTVNVGDVMTRFEIRDAEENMIGTFRANLQDEKLIGRICEFRDTFVSYKTETKGFKRRQELDAAAQEAFCRLLGYDCRPTLFSVLTPSTRLESGEIFASVIMKALSDAFVENAKSKLKASVEAMRRHTEKYENDGV